jgi:ATP-binding protein involved in chromosome partitioning
MSETQGREILAVNVDLGCDRVCERCEKFFDCNLPYKKDIFSRRRMSMARQRLSTIKYKIAVVGGKGGVGKTLTAVNLATALAMKGRKVSILDQDFDGPCVPKMLGVSSRLLMGDNGIKPAEAILGIQVVSTGLILEADEVLTWYHDMRRNATEEFLSHVEYGERDYLLVDMPPGTSSDAANLLQYIPDLAGAVVVTVPSEVSQGVARKASLLCRKAGCEVFGIVENMSGFVCPHCSNEVYILQKGGGEALAEELGVPFLGRIPLDPKLSYCSDLGIPFVYQHPESPASKAMVRVADNIEARIHWAACQVEETPA